MDIIIKLKEVIWVGSSKKDLFDLPKNIVRDIGYGLYHAQLGKKDRKAKPLKGYRSAGVLEIVILDDSGTYRAVYTVNIPPFVFVLHVFQKKSKRGIETPKIDLQLIDSRLKEAKEIHKKRLRP